MNMLKQPPKIFQGQALHLGSLVFLLSIVFIVWGTLGKPNGEIFWFSIFIPILHQVFVWLTWRIELSSAGVSKTIGTKSYYIIFFLFLVSRVVSIFALGWQNSHSIILSDVIQLGSSLSLGLVWLYLAYSVKKHFGFVRAAGADHFESKYRDLPLVNKGIFQYTNNAMYVFGFLIFWAIAIGFESSACLLSTGFSHAYIWVHYYATEKPDIDYLYSN